MLIYLCILFPLALGALLPLFRFKSMKSRGIYTFAVTLITSIMVLFVLKNRTENVYRLFSVMDGFDLAFRVDGVSTVFAGLVAFLWPFAVLYATEYMEHEEYPDKFFAYYTMSYGIALSIAFSANLFTMYVFYECLTIVTLPLVTHKGDPASIAAGRKYALFSIGGASLSFIAIMLISHFGTTMDFTLGGVLTSDGVTGHETLMRVAYILAFIGFGTKAAVFPMYSWLPKASVAPTPVTALLHAVAVVNTGAFAVLRVTYYSFGTEFLYGTFAQITALTLACFTVVFASVMAVREQHLKRRLAYSTISNLSYMLMGTCLMTPLGMAGSLTHMVTHSFMKIVLFYCAGAFLVNANVEYVQELRGIHKKMPVTCIIFTLAAVALAGMPPLCGFISKWKLLTASAASPLGYGKIGAVALIISAVLTIMYMFPAVINMFLKNDDAALGAKTASAHDPTWRMLLPLGVFCICIIVIGCHASPLLDFLSGVSAGTIF